MPTSIGAVSDLVAVIQAQLSTRAGGTARPRPAKSEKSAAPRYARENLGRLIELRVKTINRDDPQAGRKAFRVFLEAVLLSQFGEALINDPDFYQMVDEVQLALDSEPGCRVLVDQAVAELLKQNTNPG